MAYNKRQNKKEWKKKRRAAFLTDKKCGECGTSEELEVSRTPEAIKLKLSDIYAYSPEKQKKYAQFFLIRCKKCITSIKNQGMGPDFKRRRYNLEHRAHTQKTYLAQDLKMPRSAIPREAAFLMILMTQRGVNNE